MIITFLYGFMFCCIMLLLLVISSMGGGNKTLSQIIFGNSGGKDNLQKAAWVLCILLLLGSLIISVLHSKIIIGIF